MNYLRVEDYGRESTLWIIFPTTQRNQIYHFHSRFESELKEIFKTVDNEESLTEPEFIENIISKLNIPQ